MAAKRRQSQLSLSRLTQLAVTHTTRAANDVRKRAEGGGGGRWLARRDLSGRANGTIDPWYGCFIYDEMIDYAFNFSQPWSACAPPLCAGECDN